MEELPEECDYKTEYKNLKSSHDELLEKGRPFLKLFEYKSINKVAGNYGTDIDSFAISMLANGKTASSIFEFFTELSLMFPVLSDDSGQTKRVSTVKYFQQLRECIPTLAADQDQKFISESESLILATDATVALHGKKVHAVAVYNEQANFHCLGYTLSGGSDGEGIKKTMVDLINASPASSEILEKITTIVSDSDRTQCKANRLFAEDLGRPLNFVPCAMHTSTY